MNDMYASEYVTASFDTLLNQAPDAVSVFMHRAISEIDNTFGDGYAAQNPQLVGAFIQASATEINGSTVAKVLGHALQEVSSSLNQVAASLEE